MIVTFSIRPQLVFGRQTSEHELMEHKGDDKLPLPIARFHSRVDALIVSNMLNLLTPQQRQTAIDAALADIDSHRKEG